jgi:hypothetical protein
MVRAAGRDDVPPSLLFDMFAHWLIDRKIFKEPPTGPDIPGDTGEDEDDEARNTFDAIFERFYPDPEERRLCATILADAIGYAHSLRPENWSVRYRRGERVIRLNVGPAEVLVLSEDLLTCFIDRGSLSDAARQAIDVYATDISNDYPSVPGPKWRVDIPAEQVGVFYPSACDGHRDYIRRASDAARGRSRFWRSYDPAVIEFLRGMLGRDLPDPAYAVELDTPDGPEVPEAEPVINPEITIAQISETTGLPIETLESWIRAIDRKRQAILYGPPGTGKTFTAQQLAAHLVGGADGFSETLQFHPAYSYEEFIEGIRPLTVAGKLDYRLVPGRFLEFCGKARERTGTCVLIVDEINRANLARVFGELMYLLEYRNEHIPLAGGSSFSIPENVRIIGTMNTADRSIALVDHALRRRFAFLELRPLYDVLINYHRKQGSGFPAEQLAEQLMRLNREIADHHYEVGISFFMRPNLAAEIGEIWEMEIEPYLREYFFDRPANAEAFRWKTIREQVLP